MAKAKVLIVGETVYKIHTHFKGFASYETGYISPGLDAFTDRFKDRNVDITFMPNHEVSHRFPSTIEAMQAFDAIVISDAPADSFLLHPDTLAGKLYPDRLRLLGDYAHAGGGVAMIGGWMAYGGFHGKAHYAYSPLAKILPVTMQGHDDRMETPEGVHPKPVADHPILKDVPTQWPDFLGYNKVEQRGGTLLLEFKETGDPLLIVDTLGKGRVACFTSDILPHWGSPRFVEWDAYLTFWEQFFCWLGGK